MSKTARKEVYRLPNNKYTTSAGRYCRAYHKLAKPIAKATDTRLAAFDKGIQMHYTDTGGFAFSLPSDTAIKLYKALTGKDYTC